MGGEVSYFVELESGTMVHAIGIAKLRPIAQGHIRSRSCGSPALRFAQDR